MYHAGLIERALYYPLFQLSRLLKVGEHSIRQRNRYAADFEQALRFDAVEAGMLPLTKAIYESGGEPLYSCEGHPEFDTRKSWHPAYLVFWTQPESRQLWLEAVNEAVQGCALCWESEMRNSATERDLASRYNGKEGTYWNLTAPIVSPLCESGVPYLRDLLDEDLATMAYSIRKAFFVGSRNDHPPMKIERSVPGSLKKLQAMD